MHGLSTTHSVDAPRYVYTADAPPPPSPATNKYKSAKKGQSSLFHPWFIRFIIIRIHTVLILHRTQWIAEGRDSAPSPALPVRVTKKFCERYSTVDYPYYFTKILLV